MSLKRELGLFDAVMLGLGSIMGTGVFVSMGIAAGVAGSGVVAAIAAAAVVATCNALSSAQLAANHPVSGGTYEYGYRWLTPWLGFAAGWMFLCAKTASAASAALGFAGYLLAAAGQPGRGLTVVAVTTVVGMTLVVLSGVRLSSRVNMAIVSVTIAALVAFVAAGLPAVRSENLAMALEPRSLLHSAALMFVAFTGYGRIATLGEEVVEPRRTIPRAIVATLVISAALYLAVAAVYVGVGGVEGLNRQAEAAPLEVVARGFPLKVQGLVAVGAMTAMLGVLLNLLLGLSRMLLAMGRRGDMPRVTANIHVAVLVVGVAITCLASVGDVKTTWSFSAFTVLVYYAITNLAALRLAPEQRLFSPMWAWCGLGACLSLAFAVDRRTWMTGLALLAAGLAWHGAQRWRRVGAT